MMRFSLENKAAWLINEAGGSGATNTTTALEHSQPVEEAEHMSRCGYSGDSYPNFKPKEHGTFTPIGKLASDEVARLREKRDAALRERHFEIAETYHHQSVLAEIKEEFGE